MNAFVITNCTGRKRSSIGTAATLPSRRVNNVDDLAAIWLRALQQAKPTLAATDLYLGRAVGEAVRVAKTTDGAVTFVSAGLGLVKGTECWPNYNLTLSKGDASISPVLAQFGVSPMSWWKAINAARGQPNPLGSLLARQTTSLLLLALPSGYLEMVSVDLASASDKSISKLRIFTSGPGLDRLPTRLRGCVMPYDSRLEASIPGTKGDFPQRSMRHFVEVLGGQPLDLSRARAAVSAAMSHLIAPQLPSRTKLDDAQIIKLIKRNWSRYDGQSSRLLRHLRDEALVACEQGRFRDLWRQVRAEKEVRVAYG